MSAAGIAFWAAGGVVAYTYVGFPLLVLARAALRPRPVRAAPIEPPVSIVIAAHDEEDQIGAKLDSLRALDYPPERLEVIVASDGSADRTNEIVESYAARADGPRVRLLALPRVGKAEALTQAVQAATGELLVFSDANSLFVPGALRALVAPCADPDVGGVAGNQVYSGSVGGSAAGERGYWSFDRLVKEAESRAGNVISATGAIYALRRELFSPVLPGVTDDFYTSTGVIAAGRRLVFARDAIAVEPVAASGEVEFGRKVRIMTRGLRGVVARRGLLDPMRHGFYAVQLLSHKVLRRVMVLPLAAAFVAGALAWSDGVVYRAATIAQASVYGLGVAGLLARDRRLGRTKALAVPAYFCMVNAASARALWNLARGNRIERWEPVRAEGAEPPARGAEEPA